MRAIRLTYRTPFDWPGLVGFFERRAIHGVEWCDEESYARTVRVGGAAGIVRVRQDAAHQALAVTYSPSLARHREEIASRVRRMFDLDADPRVIAAHFRDDELLGTRMAAHPGIRVPGAWDPFEMAVRAVVGQQISVGRARSLLSQIAAEHGERLGDGAILFPDAARLAAAPPAGGMPRARLETLRLLAEEAAGGRLRYEIDSLRRLRGIGDWTANYIAMRALRAPDAFPTGDVALRKAAGRLTSRELDRLAERWRPWRAYACMLLWS